jgi:hypothetical protein
MTWKTATIKLAPAQTIFASANIQPIEIGDKTVGYRATHKGQTLENASLTELCVMLWAVANG